MTVRRILLIVSCLAYSVLLNYVYASTEAPNWAYTGLHYKPPGLWLTLLGYLLAVAPSLWMPIRLERPSQIAYWWLYVSVIVPSMFIPFHVLDRPPIWVLPLPLALFACFSLLGASYKIRRLKLPRIQVTEAFVSTNLLLFFAVMLGIICFVCQFRFSLSLEDIYERRLAVRGDLTGGSLFSYSLAALKSSVIPFVLAVGIARQKIFWIGVGLVGTLICFSYTGERTVFFAPLFMLLLFPLVKYCRQSFAFFFIAGVIGVVAACWFETKMTGGLTLSGYFSRRLLLVPAQVTAYYYDYFSDHDVTYFSQSLLKFFASTSAVPTGRLIGEVYFTNPDANCTGNVWATSYSELRFAGMLIGTLILSSLFLVIDNLTDDWNFHVACLLTGLMGLTWSEVSVLTSLLSSGVALNIAFLAFISIKHRYATIQDRAARNPLQGCVIETRGIM